MWRLLWGLFGGAAVLSFVLVGLTMNFAAVRGVTLIFGGILFVLAIILVFVVAAHEEKKNPTSEAEGAAAFAIGFLGGLAGVAIYIFLRYAWRWPQPLLLLLLGIATFVGGAALGPREGAPAPGVAGADGANTVSADRPFKVDPKAKSAGKTLYVASLTPFGYKAGPWKLGIGVKGEDEKSPIVLQQKEYKHGISMHPPQKGMGSCRVSFLPSQEFKRMKGWAGIGDYHMPPQGTVVFAVYGDDRKLWESAPLGKSGAAVDFDIDVTGVDVLTLETRLQDGTYGFVHATWLDPWLER
jgi:hypothetical protein